MDAPKRIWANPSPDDHTSPASDDWDGGHWDIERYKENGSVEYILASAHDAEVAGLKAQIERLRKAVVELAIPLEALRMTGGTVLTDEIVRATDIARAAINGDDNG